MNNFKILSECADFVTGKIHSDNLEVAEYISTDNILSNKRGVVEANSLPAQPGNVTSFSKGDILVANIRPYLRKIWYSDKSGGCSADVLTFRSKEGINSKFLYYALFREDFFEHIMRGSKGTKMPRGDKNQIMDFWIPDFTPSDQSLIENCLSLLDMKISNNNCIINKLEAVAKILYDYWFVQYDFPDTNGNPYKTSDGKMIYSQILKREIPEGWNCTIISRVLETVLGGTPSTKIEKYWEGATIPWLSSAETANFPVIDSEQKITQKGIENSAATLLPMGTIVVSIVRYIRPSILGIDAATNQSVVGINENSKLKSSFIYPYLNSEVPRLMSLRTGAQQPHINKGVIDDSPIIIPPNKILHKYYDIADPIFQKIINLALENHHLIKLRDWLLPMFMNGQIKVK